MYRQAVKEKIESLGSFHFLSSITNLSLLPRSSLPLTRRSWRTRRIQKAGESEQGEEYEGTIDEGGKVGPAACEEAEKVDDQACRVIGTISTSRAPSEYRWVEKASWKRFKTKENMRQVPRDRTHVEAVEA